MKLIFLYGPPASGKLTIARELASLTGCKLFHNHLVVDALLAVFDFGSQPFIQLREEIWLSVFARACKAHLPGMIFTFAPEQTVRPAFVSQALATVQSHGGEIVFVEVTCPLPELKSRLSAESRQQHGKLTSVSLFETLQAQGAFHLDGLPEPHLVVDSGLLNPHEAAVNIANYLEGSGSQ